MRITMTQIKVVAVLVVILSFLTFLVKCTGSEKTLASADLPVNQDQGILTINQLTSVVEVQPELEISKQVFEGVYKTLINNEKSSSIPKAIEGILIDNAKAFKHVTMYTGAITGVATGNRVVSEYFIIDTGVYTNTVVPGLLTHYWVSTDLLPSESILISYVLLEDNTTRAVWIEGIK